MELGRHLLLVILAAIAIAGVALGSRCHGQPGFYIGHMLIAGCPDPLK